MDALIHNQFITLLNNVEKTRKNGFVVFVYVQSDLTPFQNFCFSREQTYNSCLTVRYSLSYRGLDCVSTLLLAAFLQDIHVLSQGENAVIQSKIPDKNDPAQETGVFQPAPPSGKWMRIIEALRSLPAVKEENRIPAWENLFSILKDVLEVGDRLVLFCELSNLSESVSIEELGFDGEFIRLLNDQMPERLGLVFSGVPANFKLPSLGNRFLGLEPGARSLEFPKYQYPFQHGSLEITVAYTFSGWRIEGIDSLYVTTSLALGGSPGTFFKAVFDDIPDDQERSRLMAYVKKQFDKLPKTEAPVALQLPPELAPSLLPYARAGKAAILVGMNSDPRDFFTKSETDAYSREILRKSIAYAGANGLTKLVMPVVGDQTVENLNQIIQTLLEMKEFGSLQTLTIITIYPPLAAAARDIFERLEAERKNPLTNNRAEAPSNDRAQGADQLGVKDEVDALADTLLLRDVEPPLAVGIIGGWGSGKSFAMHLLRERVKETRARKITKGWPSANADQNQPDPIIPAYVGHIYQIEFNAWTYAKSNLWASLMDTIFSTLNRQMQLELLLAHKEISKVDDTPAADTSQNDVSANGTRPKTNYQKQIEESLLAGGDEFKKIYQDNLQIDKDKDLEKWQENLANWSQHLFKGTLLWNVMRGQQVETIKNLKDVEEQLDQLKKRRDQFEKDRSLEGITSKSLDEKTALPAYVQSLKNFILAFLSEQLSKSAKEELQKHDISDDDVQKYLKEARGLLGGGKTLYFTFRQNKWYLPWTIIFLVLTFSVPYLWSKYALEFVQYRVVAQIITSIFTLLPTLTGILPWIKKSIESGVEAKKILEGAHAAQQAKKAEEIASATDVPLSKKTSALQAEIAKGNVAAYDALINLLETQANEQRQKIGPSAKFSNLKEFVQSRLDAATYENKLGLMHQIRQDIYELTYSLIGNANPEIFPRGIPRVILYIDDLDRCPPSRVVEILEAVQLLLSTELFVVILGLDTRYVTRALEKEYKEILKHEGDPSGLDYIEKIIQIPYRVRPIETKGLQNFLKEQMKTKFVDETTSGKKTASTPVDQPKGDQPVQLDTSSTKTPARKSQLTPEEIDPPELANFSRRTIDLPAAIIRFNSDDLADVNDCCQKISLTPRSIKRIVNVLKLMKILWYRTSTATSGDRDQPRPIKQAVIILLALSSAYPEVMREAFVHLETLYRKGDQAINIELFTALKGVQLPPDSLTEIDWQLDKFKTDLGLLQSLPGSENHPHYGYITLADFAQTTFNLTRSFSFVGDPVYWSDGEHGTSRLRKNHPIKPPAKENRNL